MYNQPLYVSYMNHYQQPYYNLQNSGYELFDEIRDVDDEVYRPDDAEDAPTTPPPSQMPSLPATFSATVQTDQMRIWMCNCLGKWGILRIKTARTSREGFLVLSN
jgi:hypothetical protein